jgi:hypothetical protein
MRRFTLLLVLVGATALAAAGVAQATVYTSTLPEFSSAGYTPAGPFPRPAVTVGTFSYSIPAGEQIVGATISGRFGNSLSGTSAGADLYLNGWPVGQCIRFGPCYFQGASWSQTFSWLAWPLLGHGSAVLTVVQTSEFFVRLAPTTLTIVTRSSPR